MSSPETDAHCAAAGPTERSLDRDRIDVLLSYNFYVDLKEKQFDCDSCHASQEKCHVAPTSRCQA